MRVFLSIPLPDQVKQELQALQASLKKDARNVRWTRPEGMHITLLFLGEYPESGFALLRSAMEPIAAVSPGFEMALGGNGVFPPRGKPAVFWVGVSRGELELTRLAQNIRSACARQNIQTEPKPFVPHVTIARAKRGDTAFLPKVDRNPLCETRFPVESFHLTESQFTPEGVIYKTQMNFILKG